MILVIIRLGLYLGVLTISDGKANIVGDGSAFTHISQGGVFTNGKRYVVKLDVVINSGLGLKFQDGANNENIGFATTSGAYTFNFTATANSNFLIGRRTGGTAFDSSVDNVSIKEYITETNTPRLDYSTGAEAFLLEPQSTNLIPYSEDFSDASWVNSNSTDTSNYGISPDGLNNSTRFLTTANTGSFLYINSLAILDATNYTLSFWVKSNNNSLDKFRLYTTTGGTSLEFTSTNKWVRYEYNFLSTGATTNLGIRGVVSQETDIQIWGAQLEEQSYATSYIPTSGTTVTRNQETCINATPEINSEEGVLYAEMAALSDDGTNRVISLNSGQRSNSVRLYFDSSGLGEVTMQVRSGNVLQVIEKYVLSNLLDFNKIAIKYKENDFALWVNGIEVNTDTSGITPIGLNTLSFNDGSLDEFFGNTKDLQVYTKALSDAELIKLTT